MEQNREVCRACRRDFVAEGRTFLCESCWGGVPKTKREPRPRFFSDQPHGEDREQDLNFPSTFGFYDLERHMVDPSIYEGVPAIVYPYFRNIKRALLNHIDAADYVVGCIAWYTDPDIIRALNEKERASVVLQKETFLSSCKDGSWNNELRELYAEGGEDLSDLSIGPLVTAAEDGFVFPGRFRCFGLNRKGTAPRMHHKFVVFGNVDGSSEQIDFHSVWAGSFNFTKNASLSLEDAELVEGRGVAQSFLLRWSQVLCMSEPLDWTSDDFSPEWTG